VCVCGPWPCGRNVLTSPPLVFLCLQAFAASNNVTADKVRLFSCGTPPQQAAKAAGYSPGMIGERAAPLAS
jgi:hypothetical protein